MKFKEIADYIKLAHTVLDIPFIVSGSFIAADGYPGTLVLILVILAGSFARATGICQDQLYQALLLMRAEMHVSLASALKAL